MLNMLFVISFLLEFTELTCKMKVIADSFYLFNLSEYGGNPAITYVCKNNNYAFGQSVGLSVGLSVRKVYCGKMVEWIRMPFGMVSGVG